MIWFIGTPAFSPGAPGARTYPGWAYGRGFGVAHDSPGGLHGPVRQGRVTERRREDLSKLAV